MVPDLLVLALDFHRAPLRYRHLTEAKRPLPQAFDGLFTAFGSALSPQNIDATAAMVGKDPARVEETARFFVRQVLLAPGADHYRTLGLPRGAAAASIRRHYHLLVRLFHPDRTSSEWEVNVSLTARINDAYNTLRDPVSRQRYDEELARSTGAANAESDPVAFFRPSDPLSAEPSGTAWAPSPGALPRGWRVWGLLALAVVGITVVLLGTGTKPTLRANLEKGSGMELEPSYLQKNRPPPSSPAPEVAPGSIPASEPTSGQPQPVTGLPDKGYRREQLRDAAIRGMAGVQEPLELAESSSDSEVGPTVGERPLPPKPAAVPSSGMKPSKRPREQTRSTDADSPPNSPLEAGVRATGQAAAAATPKPKAAKHPSPHAPAGAGHEAHTAAENASVPAAPRTPRQTTAKANPPKTNGVGAQHPQAPASRHAKSHGVPTSPEHAGRGHASRSPNPDIAHQGAGDAVPAARNHRADNHTRRSSAEHKHGKVPAPSARRTHSEESKAPSPQQPGRGRPAAKGPPDAHERSGAVARADKLIRRFSQAYEGGDVHRFVALFASNAQVNEGRGIAFIRKDYGKFFARTPERHLDLRQLSWRPPRNGRLTGRAVVRLAIRDQGASRWRRLKGTVDFELIETRRGLRISKMIYVLRPL